jgi:catechol 2,3-dioxygenase-like lactoylglutathione lyase family enzyme
MPASNVAPLGPDEFRVGKLFHLTPLVDSFADAEYFFTSLFAPMAIMRNYAEHWHRHGAIYVIADTAIEPMQPLPPRDGEEATSWFRYMDKYGPHVHNIAFYAENIPALTRRLQDAGVRTTNGGGVDTTVFAHPKDTPGMLEFSESGDYGWYRRDPRFSAYWPAFRDDFWPTRQGLGIERLSHITVVVNNCADAARFYRDVLDAVPLPEQDATVDGAESAFVMVGEDTVLELAQPCDESSLVANELRTVGQCVTTVTFTVRDVGAAEEHLRFHGAPIATADERLVTLDRTRTWNMDYRFTDVALTGDPRLERQPTGQTWPEGRESEAAKTGKWAT